ncbi:hypothetical protein [uncultured Dialister sp.]|jgi:chromosome segregation ATPase|uniref:hypothetical protein n=1 Tax=uncultured Dialister sp. TaxID=278064 RepID=UPI0025E5FD2E|nr:hypothetical protein [uncultured Dialister sp.]
MSAKDLQKEGFLTACKTIQALKGTVECLQINLSQERDNNEGLNLTIESLRNENNELQEKVFQLEAELQAVKEEEKPAGPSSEVVEELEKKLGFYCKDLKKLDEKNLTAEDSEILYNILAYTFKTLKKAGLKL